MLEDTDISSTRHARAAVGGLIAGLAGTGAVYVSGGAEHQGPPGGGPGGGDCASVNPLDSTRGSMCGFAKIKRYFLGTALDLNVF